MGRLLASPSRSCSPHKLFTHKTNWLGLELEEEGGSSLWGFFGHQRQRERASSSPAKILGQTTAEMYTKSYIGLFFVGIRARIRAFYFLIRATSYRESPVQIQALEEEQKLLTQNSSPPSSSLGLGSSRPSQFADQWMNKRALPVPVVRRGLVRSRAFTWLSPELIVQSGRFLGQSRLAGRALFLALFFSVDRFSFFSTGLRLIRIRINNRLINSSNLMIISYFFFGSSNDQEILKVI